MRKSNNPISSVRILFFCAILWSCKENINSTSAYTQPEWVNTLSLYEITPYQYKDAGGLQGITNDLQRIHRLFFTGIVLHPVTVQDQANNAFNPSSPFAIQSYQAIEASLGTSEDLNILLDSAKNLGLKVIYAWNVTETGPHHPWRSEQPTFYKSNDKMRDGRYNTAYVALDPSKREVQREIVSEFEQFSSTFDFDGYILFGDSTDIATCIPLFERACPKNGWIAPNLGSKAFSKVSGKNPALFPFIESIFRENYDSVALETLLNETTRTQWMHAFIDYELNWKRGTDYMLFPNAYTYYIMLTHFLPGIPWTLNGQENGLTQAINPFDHKSLTRQFHFNEDLFRSLNLQRRNNKALQFSSPHSELKIIGRGRHAMAIARQAGNQYIVGIFNFGDEKTSIQLDVFYPNALDLFNKIPVQYPVRKDIFLGPYQALMFSNVP